MKITMVSNYINHHQIPLSEALYERLGDGYRFIQTEEMERKRIDMGWAVNPDTIPYVISSYKDIEAAKEAIDSCDVLIIGWIQDESIVADRLNSGKPCIRISERLYREGQWKAISPKGLMRKYHDHIRYRKAPVYLLCNGAYVASDFSLIGAYPDKKYKFGYFPKTRNYYNPEELWKHKPSINVVEVEYAEELPEELPTLTENNIEIVWAGRFMELKHPEYMVKLAGDLNRLGYRFHIHMIGSGDMEDELKKQAEYELVDDHITFHGFMNPEEVRDMMEKCHIHIFTSNFLEGWGAVVNEGMNAGCAEVVNAEVGAAPFLIKDGVNGLLYQNGEYENMRSCVFKLLEQPDLIKKYGKEAYDTIVMEWNAEVAAERLLTFSERIVSGDSREVIVAADGPLSVAEVIKPRFWASGKLGE